VQSEQRFAPANTYVREEIKLAKATTRVVEKTRQVLEKYTEQDGVILELTDDEAAYLTALLGSHVGGGHSIREHNDNIWSALCASGFSMMSKAKVTQMETKMSGMVILPRGN
jgi:hypothetical protein